jgi:hypothetical protein
MTCYAVQSQRRQHDAGTTQIERIGDSQRNMLYRCIPLCAQIVPAGQHASQPQSQQRAQRGEQYEQRLVVAFHQSLPALADEFAHATSLPERR